MKSSRFLIAIVLIFDLSQGAVNALAQDGVMRPTTVTIWFKPGQPLTRFVPSYALGAAIDGHEKGEINQMLSPANIREMLTAGLKPITYRLRTELAGEAWHWNPVGNWSQQNSRQGYWTSTSDLTNPISVSYGYRLPRRGNTIDQANDDGYSRLDDGDVNSFWKSNPYLDKAFTQQGNSNLPQWVLLDLGEPRPVDSIRILWAQPFATHYDIQYGYFAASADISSRLPETWRTFERGTVRRGEGGDETIHLCPKPLVTQFVRILMKGSSEKSDRAEDDVRDRLGYAIREIYLGTLDQDHNFHDLIKHSSTAHDQTTIYVSSTDPWHREVDKDDLIEQLGFDRLYTSGLTNGLPVTIPVGVLYDTPENAAAEIRYLKARNFPIERVELGEEPDGQFVAPEDYAALYIQFAKALHAVDPGLRLGGPSFQDIEPGETPHSGKPEWLRRFMTYLMRHGYLDDYTFASFEWYPFDAVCQRTAPQLAQAGNLLKDSFDHMRAASLKRDLPWVITEYGYSAYATRAEMDLEGALLNADIVGTFLTQGGNQMFLYGYEPNEVIEEFSCTAGNNMMFLLGQDSEIQRLPTYYSAVLLTREWAKPGNGMHELYRSTTDNPAVNVYALQRPDSLMSLMFINKDPDHTQQVLVKFSDRGVGFSGPIDLYQYSAKQFELNSDPHAPYPVKNLPPEHFVLDDSFGSTLKLPPYSITIARGAVLTSRNNARPAISN